MDSWIVPLLVIAAIALVVGNLSTVQKNAKTPIRKKGLNDLKETLPRSNKTEHKLPTAPSNTNNISKGTK
jgi:hypothetical protein